jgi:hypothetical protein
MSVHEGPGRVCMFTRDQIHNLSSSWHAMLLTVIMAMAASCRTRRAEQTLQSLYPVDTACQGKDHSRKFGIGPQGQGEMHPYCVCAYETSSTR